MAAVAALPLATKIGLGVSAVSAVASYQGAQAARKGAKAQSRAATQSAALQRQQIAQERRMRDIQAARERFAAVRQSRISRATAQQAAVNMGAGFGSGIVGGAGGQMTRTAEEVGSSYQLQGMAAEASQLAQRRADVESRGIAAAGRAEASGAMWGAIGGISGSIFQAGGSWGAVRNKNWGFG